jgi:tetratricopeptide (TPR) repeat protein
VPLDPWEKLPYYYDGGDEEYKPKVVESAPSLDQAYELKGTVAFRQNRLEEALAAFEQLPDDYWKKNYAFSGYLNQDPFASPKTYPWEGETIGTYNKKVILRRMLELKKQAEQPGPQQAEACYLLGNAYYNFTYWGKNWMMFAYGKSVGELYHSPYVSWENYSFEPNSTNFFKEYFQLSRANAYYQKAFKAKPAEDLAARIIFMLGTCDKYAHHDFDHPYWEEDETEPYISPIFNTFRDQFGHTEVFKDCLNTCPELADYFKK